MTYAELLRKYATDATNEGGMWFSGEYMTVLASIAESIEAENAKLREEVEQWHRLTAGIELPKYPVTEFHPKDLERENAKLRKLAQRMWRLERFGCYGCRQECDAESCYANDCKEATEIEQEMRDLGIEVPR